MNMSDRNRDASNGLAVPPLLSQAPHLCFFPECAVGPRAVKRGVLTRWAPVGLRVGSVCAPRVHTRLARVGDSWRHLGCVWIPTPCLPLSNAPQGDLRRFSVFGGTSTPKLSKNANMGILWRCMACCGVVAPPLSPPSAVAGGPTRYHE